MENIYPRFDTSTAQDLMSIVAQAYGQDIKARGITLPAKSRRQRACLEPLGIALGMLAAALLEKMPEGRALRVHECVLEKLSSPNSYPFAASSPALRGAGQLLDELSRGGKEPALLAVISHPPVLGEAVHLNFELMRHGVSALCCLRRRPCRPRLVVAVDPFALDSVPLWQEGLYAGFMARYHLGLDRMIRLRKGIGRRLLRKTAWFTMPHRLLGALSQGEAVGMVLAGGVPSTARSLYAFREWLGRQLRLSPRRSRPGEVLSELKKNADFRLFFERCAPLPWRSSWRLLEAWCLGVLAGSAADGRLEPGGEEALRACLAALALDEPEAGRALADLEREWARETPYRERFFRLLAGRVLAKGRPILFLPVVHRGGGVEPLGVEIRNAWGWAEGGLGGVQVLRPGRGPESLTAEAFARSFGEENFK